MSTNVTSRKQASSKARTICGTTQKAALWRRFWIASLLLALAAVYLTIASRAEVKRLTETFKRQDERRLYEEYQYHTDLEKMRANALSQAKELEELFTRDIEELPEDDDTPQPERAGERVTAQNRDGR